MLFCEFSSSAILRNPIREATIPDFKFRIEQPHGWKFKQSGRRFVDEPPSVRTAIGGCWQGHRRRTRIYVATHRASEAHRPYTGYCRLLLSCRQTASGGETPAAHRRAATPGRS